MSALCYLVKYIEEIRFLLRGTGERCAIFPRTPSATKKAQYIPSVEQYVPRLYTNARLQNSLCACEKHKAVLHVVPYEIVSTLDKHIVIICLYSNTWMY